MTNFKLWAQVTRAPFFTATIIPVILGAVLAWYDTGSLLWARFLLSMFGALCIHAGTNMANDYFDHLSGCDEANPNPTPFSGGSRSIQNKLIHPKKVLYAALSFFTLGCAAGLYLNYLCVGNAILIIGLIGVFLGFFYTAGPFRIGYGSLGELAVGTGFGPLMVLGAYYVQTQALSFRIFLISIPVGILIALVLFINEFPDFDSDKNVGKRTWVVILGKRSAIKLYHLALVFTYVMIAALVFFGLLPRLSMAAFLGLPLAIKAFTVSKRNFGKIHELLPANAATIALHSLTGLLICAGILLDGILTRINI